MRGSSDIKQILDEVLCSKNYERLDELKGWEKISSLSDDDRELLGVLFLKAGESKLNTDEIGARRSFDLALEVAPKNPEVLYQKGEIYAKQKNSISSLKSAIDYFRQTVELDNTFWQAWFKWACSLKRLADILGDSFYYQKADEKFHHAEKLVPQNKEQRGDFYWQWGLTWYESGRQSEEIYDYKIALDKFGEARTYGARSPQFWNDYAQALAAMGRISERPEFLEDAIRFYRKAVMQDQQHFDGWYNLACLLSSEYEKDPQEKTFFEAHNSFSKASRIDGSRCVLWLKWGQLLAFSGKIRRHVKRLEHAISKYASAKRLQPDHPVVYRQFGEVLLILGSLIDSIDFLKQAESNIVKALEMAPDDHAAWYHYGRCLIALGRYFDDESYCHQAIQKFQHGLKLEDNSPLQWYGNALAYLAIAEMNRDIELLYKADHCFKQAYSIGETYPGFWNNWGVVLICMAEFSDDKSSLAEAVEKFEHLLNNYPEERQEAEWFYNYGCTLDFLGEHTGDEEYFNLAVQHLTRAIVLDPDNNEACYNLALALSHLGVASGELEHLYRSIEFFQSVINSEEEDDMAWNEWGMALLCLSQMVSDPACPESHHKFQTEAEEKFMRAASLGNLSALYNLATLYSLAEKYEEAIYYLERSYEQGGLPKIEEILTDSWLEGLKTRPRFREFLDYVQRDREQEEL
ncbi:MAG: tetratricopeptide repeat protein [Chlamydiota bacterium]